MSEPSAQGPSGEERDPTRELFRRIGWGPVLGFVMFWSVFPFAMDFDGKLEQRGWAWWARVPTVIAVEVVAMTVVGVVLAVVVGLTRRWIRRRRISGGEGS